MGMPIRNKDKKIYYYGSFPPPFGGVTVKNSIIVEWLKKRTDVKVYDFKRSGLIKTVGSALFGKMDQSIFGFGNSHIQKFFIALLAFVNPNRLHHIILISMGGIFPAQMANDSHYRAMCKKLSGIYVETKSMVKALEEQGFQNVALFPNCRHFNEVNITDNRNEPIKLVFFSIINPEKGVFRILDALKSLIDERISFLADFWGPIDPEIEKQFLQTVSEIQCCEYKGVFDSAQRDPCTVLSQYDVVLLPTSWKAEGVPGILVEAKGAGIPAIVSNINYNSEIITNGIDGIVLEENTSQVLKKAIIKLTKDRNLLYKMKVHAKEDSRKYEITYYAEELFNHLNNM